MSCKWLWTLLLVSSSGFAQTSFFTIWPGHPDFSPLPPPPIPGVEAEYPVSVDVRALVLDDATRQQFSVRFADGSTRVFGQRRFVGEEGFVALGASDIQPDPSLPDSALSYYWFGMSENETISVGVHHGRISATVITAARHFALTEADGGLVFRQFNPALVPTDALLGTNGLAKAGANLPLAGPIPKTLDPIDVLVLHTPSVLAAISQAQLDAAIAEAFGQSETTLLNSGVVSVRLRNVAVGGSLSTLINYNEAPPTPPGCTAPAGLCRWIGHRVFLRTDPTVQSLRNSSSADLVVMVVADQNSASGVAYIQKPNCGVESSLENSPGCSVGVGYNPFAFAVVSLPFITSFQVFAHETGHQLGMEHNVANGSAVPSFPWSYGWFVNGRNETVMSVAGAFGACGSGCPRALQYSNPNIPFLNSAVPSGTASAFNARTVASLAPAVSEFRNPQLIGLLFRSDFEALPIP